jgi:hypothetical protein
MTYDVIVVGGGAAGIAAAVGAQSCGAKTLLIEQYGCLGGAATMRNVLTYCGLYTAEEKPRRAVRGVADLLLAKLEIVCAISVPIRKRGVFVAVDSEAVKWAFDTIALESGFDLALHTVLTGANRVGEQIKRITIFDHSGSREVEAKAFVDASGEADLAGLSGASVRYGNEGAINVGTLAIRFGGIDPNADLSSSAIARAIRRAKATGNKALDQEHGLVTRLPLSGDVLAFLVDAEYNALDGRSIGQAEMLARKKAWEYFHVIRQMPGCEKAYINSTGPMLGTRESRHLNGKYQLTQEDIKSGCEFEDVIALGAWAMEYHPRAGDESSWIPIANQRTFDIPLRSLQSIDTVNLFGAGRVIDGDRYAGASVRVMGTALATGHAAGIAAAHYTQSGSVDIKAVQQALLSQGALLNL